MQPILARTASAITPHDTNPNVFNAIYCGGAGTIALRPRDATSGSVNFVAVAAGTILPVATSLVLSTGTTATNLVGLNW